jgi:hypothetical protein
VFTLQNTGNLPLTGVLQGTLGGTNPTDWSIIRLLSTCGPAGGGQLLGQTTLAVAPALGSACAITVQFRPLTTEPLNSLSATLSVTDAAGTQTSALTGTATGAGLASIAPTSGVRGTTVPITLTGTNLTVATAVNVSGTGVTCTITGPTPRTATTLTASCVIAPAATLGAHNVTVATPTGASNAVTFTVRGATVAFAGPTPSLVTGTTTTHSGTITVSNAAAATGPLTLTAAPTVTKVGAAGGTFSITGGTCVLGAVVNPASNCTITVQYAPGTSGTTTATANVTVTGTGLAAATLTSANFTAN